VRIPGRPTGVRARQVNAFLDAKMAMEPSHENSVREWIARDTFRSPKVSGSMTVAAVKEAEKLRKHNNRILNLELAPKKNFDGSKRTIYLRGNDMDELHSEALRQDRSLSWLMQQAWKFARDTIREFPEAP
jgi:uncharacterized small protein (TIGR04563 family)